MKKYERKNLNIKRLLELGDLDMRAVAQAKPMLLADAYFLRVEEFIAKAPELSQTLLIVSELEKTIEALKKMEEKLGVSGRTVDFAQDTEILKNLEQIRYTLLEIGHDKLDVSIERILDAIRDGELKYAENLGVETFNMFSMLFDRVNSAYSVKRFKALKDDDEAAEEYEEVSLKDALEYYDDLEANRKLRVLAVDDVGVVLNTITSVLSPYYEVFALKSSTQVEQFLMQNTPELFLLDIEMSDMNGFDLVPLIRQFDEHKETPIIFLTGNASYNNLKDAIALGACDFITKPVKQDILLEKITKNIVRKKAY